MRGCLTLLVLGLDSACFLEFTNFCKLETSDKGIPASNGEKNYYSSTKPNVVGGRIIQRAYKDPAPSHSCFRIPASPRGNWSREMTQEPFLAVCLQRSLEKRDRKQFGGREK